LEAPPVPEFILSPSQSTDALQPIDDMLQKVAMLIGVQDDPDGRALALSALDEAAGWINLSGTYLLCTREFSVSPGDGDTTIPLPDDFAWPFGNPRLVKTTDDTMRSFLTWVPWDTFWLSIPIYTNVGLPLYISVREPVKDKVAYIWPKGSTTSAGYTLTVPYLARITRPSEASGTQLFISDELRTTLVAGAKAFVMQQRYVAQPQIWSPYWKLFEEALARFRGAGDRQQELDGAVQFTLDEPVRWVPRSYVIFSSR